MNNRKKSDFKSIKESIILIIIFLLIALFFLKGCVDNNKVKNDGIKIINIKQKVSNFDDDTIYLNKSLKKDKKYSYDVTIHNYYNEDYYLYKIEINNESIDYDDLVKLLKHKKDTKIRLTIKPRKNIKSKINIKFYYGKLKEIKIEDDIISFFGNEKVQLPKGKQKEGYKFLGYSDINDSIFVKYKADKAYFFEDGTRLYPIYEEIKENPNTGGNITPSEDNADNQKDDTKQEEKTKYIVTFDYQNGNPSTTKEVTNTETYGTLPTAVKTGYSFRGWYLNDTKIKSDTIVNLTGNVTLKAKYIIINYSINYNLSGGTSNNNPKIYNVETDDITLYNPVKSGYVFVGWTGSNGDVPEQTVIIKKGSTGNKSYKANYSANEEVNYTVVHKKEKIDGSYDIGEEETFKAPYNSVVKPRVKSYDGFNSPSEQEITVKQDGSSSVEYKYTRKKYSFVMNDSESIISSHESGEYPYETEITLTAKEKEGYNFTSWSNGETTNPTTITLTENTTIRPIYSPKTYVVEFNSNTGSGEMSNQSFSYDEEKALSNNTYTKIGNKFIGWNTKADGSGTSYLDKQVVKNLASEGTITLYAQFIADTYIISFNTDGGEELFNIERTYGETYGTLPEAVKTGYTFIGWYLGDKKIESDTVVDITSDTTLKARYNIITYNITYNLAGGIASNPSTYTVEDSITLNNPTKEGYTFSGWTGSNGDSLQTLVTIPKGSINDKTYTAHYSPNANTKYVVKHKKQKLSLDGYVLEETETLYGASDTKVTPATKNYIGFTSPALQEITIKADGTTELEYKYDRKMYTYTITDPDTMTSSLTSGDYPYGTEVTVTANAKEGYTFSSWSNGEIDNPATFTIDSNINIEPIYNANKYYVVFNNNTGSGSMLDQEMTYDSDEVLNKSIFTKEGYTFKNWNTKADGEGTTYADEATVKNLATSGNFILYATWEAKTDTQYKVITKKQNLDLETYTETTNIYTGTTDTEVTPTVVDYTGFVSPIAQTIIITGDGQATITYTYNREMYNFNLTDTENVISSKPSGEYPYGTEITLTAKDKAGYTFDNWSDGNTDNPRTITLDSDITIEPRYTANINTSYTVKHYKQKITLDGYDLADTDNLTGTTDTEVTPGVKTYTGFTSPSTQTVTIKGDGTTEVTYNYVRKLYSFNLTDTENVISSKESGEYPYGTEITLTAKDKVGYTFEEWSDGNTDNPRTITLDSNITIEPRYEANTNTSYTVKHYKQNLALDGYDLADTDNLTGTTDTKVTPPVRTYTGFNSPISQEVTIKGDGTAVVNYNYTRKLYTFTLNGNDDVVSSHPSGSYPYETEITLTANDKEGYNFEGWSNGDTNKTTTISLTDNITIEPVYSSKTDTAYTVIHKQMNIDGEGYTTKETELLHGTTGSKVTPSVKTYTGFTSPEPEEITIKADGSASVTYNYTRNKYDFAVSDRTYVDESTSTKNGKYYYQTEISVTATNREGYTFAGWSNGDGILTTTFNLEEDTTITPAYNPNIYYIVFNSNTGSGSMSDQEMTYNVEANITKNTFTKTGYTFAGWNINPNGTGATYVDEATVKNLATSGNVNLYAQWVANTDTPYKVIHKKQNLDLETYTEIEENYTATTNQEITPIVNTYTGFESPQPQTTTVKPDGTTVVTYVYNRKMYEFSLTDTENIVSSHPNGEYPYETVISLQAQEKSGYTFTGWSNGETSNPLVITLTDDIDISPIYEVKQDVNYKVVHRKQKLSLDGYDVEEEIVSQGQAGAEVTPAVKTYTGFTSPQPQTTTISSDGSTVITYNYDRINYTLTYDNTTDIDTTLSTPEGSYPYETEITLTAKEKAGYTFTGWSNGGTTNPLNVTLTNNLTIKPLYVVNTKVLYKVIHRKQNVDGETYFDEVEERFGETGTEITPTVKSYTGFISPDSQTTTINGDGTTEVIYVYDRIIYTLSFNGSENVLSNHPAGEYPFGTEVVITAKKRIGYAFTGWSNDSADETLTFKLIENTTIYPSYSTSKYEITFEPNGGSGTSSVQAVNRNEPTKLNKNIFTRSGYAFDSWNTEPDGSGTYYFDEEEVTDTTDFTLYALWAPSDKAARIGNTYYTTVANAITAVPTTGVETEVVLLKNVSEKVEIPSTKNVKLNLQNYTISNSGSTNVIVNNGKLKLFNGTISSTAGSGAINNNSTGTLDVSGGRIVMNGTRQAIYNDGGTLTISGDAYLYSASTVRAALHNLNNGKITITGGTIESSSLYAIYNEKGTLNIGTKDGTIVNTPVIEGNTFGIVANSKFNFYDGIIRGDSYHVGTATTGSTPTVAIDTDETKINEIETDSTKNIVTKSYSPRYTLTLVKNGSEPEPDPDPEDTVKKKIKFEPNGGHSSELTRMVNKGEKLGELPTFTKNGYISKGWYTESEGGDEVTKDTVVTMSTTYFAQYISTLDKAQISPIRIAMKDGDERQISVTGPEDMEPYTFTSNDENIVYVNSTGKVTANDIGITTITITGSLSGITKTVEVEVIEPKMCKVTFEVNGGVSEEEFKNVLYGTAIGTLPNATKGDLVLDAWYTGLQDGLIVTEETIIYNDITLYAKYREKRAEFAPGQEFNVKLKSLAENQNPTKTTTDSNITSIEKANNQPDLSMMTDDNIISSEDSDLLIYAWYENGKIYWWSDTDVVYTNPDSSYMYYGLTNLEEIDFQNYQTDRTTNLSYAFGKLDKADSIDYSLLDTSNVTDMSYLFTNSGLTQFDISVLDTSNVTNMSYMFYYCNKLENIDLSDIDTSNVTNISYMFSNCSSLTELDLSSFDTSKITNFNYIFNNTKNIVTLDLSNWDLSNYSSSNFTSTLSITGITELKKLVMDNVVFPKKMAYCFANLSNAEIISLNNVDTSNVTDMSYLFYNSKSIIDVDLSSFDTHNVTNMTCMFNGAESLKNLDLSSFDTSNVNKMSSMFSGLYSLEAIYASDKFITDNVPSDSSLFASTPFLTGGMGTTFSPINDKKNYAIIDEGEDNPGYFTDKNAEKYTITFDANGGEVTINEKQILVGSRIGKLPTAYQDSKHFLGWYTDISDGIKIDKNYIPSISTTLYAHWTNPITEFDTGQIVNKKLKVLSGSTSASYSTSNTNIVSIQKSSVQPDISLMGDNNIISSSKSILPIYAWFDNGTIYWWSEAETAYLNKNSSYLFNNMRGLSNIDTNSFDTSYVVDMSYMFSNNISVTNLDLSSWNTRQVENMTYIFSACTSLESINLSSFDTSNVVIMSYMFYNCSSLTSLNLDNFDTSNVEIISSMFSGCKSLESLDLSSFDTSNVLAMSNMFYDCDSLTVLNLNNFNTSNASYMSSIFSSCDNLEELYIKNFDFTGISTTSTSTSSSLNSIASSTNKLRIIDLSNAKFGLSASNQFQNFKSLEEINLSNADTSRVTNMANMFYYCQNITSLDLRSFDTSNVTNMANMFYNNTSIEQITVSDGFEVGQVVSSTSMFTNDTNLVGGQGTTYDSSHNDKEYARYDGGQSQPGYFNSIDYSSKYKIIFNNDGVIKNKYITRGEAVGSLPTYSKTGHIFDGWYLNNTKITSDYVPTHDIELIAKYNKKSYQITFDSQGGSSVNPISKEYNSELGELPTPTKDGYVFAGWYNTPNYNIYAYPKTIIYKDMTLYAKWDDSSYDNTSITYNSNGGSFENGNTNIINYDYYIEEGSKKVSHSSNINDDGVAKSGYNSLTVTDVVSIPGAKKLKIDVWFSTVGISSYLAIYSPDIIPTSSNYTESITGRLYGHGDYDGYEKPKDQDSDNHKTIIIDGNTVQFYFYPYSKQNYYGYYATITPINVHYTRDVNYEEPSLNNKLFVGWNTEPDGSGDSYLDEDSILYNLSNIENNVLYAQFIEEYSTFIRGIDFNDKIKKLANNSDYTSDSYDSKIKQIVRADTLPNIELTSDNIVSTPDSINPIYVWYDNNVIYYYSKSGTLYSNDTSSYMFYRLNGLLGVDLSTIDTSKVTSMNSMFSGCNALKSLDLSNFNTRKVTSMNSMFYGCSKLEELDLFSFDTVSLTDMGYMFYGCSGLKGLNVSTFNTKRVSSMYYTFYGCSNLTELDITNFDTKSVTNMSYMFYNCSKLEELDLIRFNTSKVTNMSYMFFNCKSLSELNLSKFSTPVLQNTSYMFNGCSNIEEIDITKFEATKITNSNYMFNNCSKLQTIFSSASLDFVNVTNTNNMFGSCTSLVGGKGTPYSPDNTDRLYAHVDGGSTNPGYFTKDSGIIITLDANGGTVTPSIIGANVNSPIGNLPTPTREGATFAGWFDDLEYTNEITSSSTFSEDTRIYAKWNVNEYTVTFNSQGGSDVPSKSIKHGSYVGELTTPTYGNKYFVGWYTESGDLIHENTVIKSAVTFYAHWYDIEENSISYNPNGGEINESEDNFVINYSRYQKGIKKVSHSSNINDLGEASSVYDNNLGQNDIVTIPYATRIRIEVWFSTESSYSDWLAIYPKGITPTRSNKSSATISKGALGGHGIYNGYEKPSDTDSSYHKVYYVNSDTAQFFFTSNSSNAYYGYYAIITGEEFVFTSDKDYQEPSYDYHQFIGWNTEIDGSGTSYLDEQSILADYNTLKDTTLYAQWVIADSTFVRTSSFHSLINSISGNTNSYSNLLVKHFTRSNNKPSPDKNIVTISTSDSISPIYAWFEDETVYWFTNAQYPQLNQYSSELFYNFENLETADFSTIKSDYVTDMSYMFYDCEKLNVLDLSKFDISNVTNVSYMFRNCSSLSSIDLSNASTNHITSMAQLFYDCRGLTTLNIQHLDTSNVTNMSEMFYNCENLIELNLSSFNTQNVTTMKSMFYNCRSLSTLYLDNFNTQNVTNMSEMFYNCNSLTSLDLDSFKTQNVTTMDSMFYNCSSLTSIDIHNFNISKVETMRKMFNGCSNMETFIGGELNLKTVTNMASMFYGCENLKYLDTTFMNAITLTDASSMFYRCKSLTKLSLELFNSISLKNVSSMFSGCSSLKELYLSGLKTNNVTSAGSMFYNCTSLEYLDITGFDLTNISQPFSSCTALKTIIANKIILRSDSSSLFAGLKKLERIELNNVDSTNLTKASLMFSECNSLESINLSSLNFSNTTTFYKLFENCYNLRNIEFGNNNTAKVTSMSYMFYGCHSLETLDLGCFDTLKVTDMSYMFYGCYSIKSIDLSSFNTSNVTNMASMFTACRSIEVIDIYSFNTSKVTNMNGMFANCTSLHTIYASNNWTSSLAKSKSNTRSMFYNDRLIIGKYGSTWGTKYTVFPTDEDSGVYSSLDVSASSPGFLTEKEGWVLINRYNLGIPTKPSEFLDEQQWSYFENGVAIHSGFRMLKNLRNVEQKFYFDNDIARTGWLVQDGDRYYLSKSDDNNNGYTDSWAYRSVTKIIDGKSYTFDADGKVTNYSGDTYLITFDANGGTPVTNTKDVIKGQSIGVLPIPLKEGKKFSGWYTADSGGTKITESTIPDGDLTYYAHWIDDYAILDTGENINVKLKKLARNTSVTKSTRDKQVQQFRRSNTLPDFEFKESNIISSSSSPVKVYAWFDDGIIYWWSDSDKIILNSDSSYLFYEFEYIKYIETTDFDTSNVTNMSHMFERCDALLVLDVSHFETINVTNMASMFNHCYNLLVLDVTNFNTINVTDMSNMFNYCYHLKSLDVTNFNTTSVTNMSGMFYYLKNVIDLNLTSFNTSNVTNMSLMFSAVGTQNLDFTNFNTSKVTNMSNMFSDYKYALDLSSFDTSKVTSMSGMFYGYGYNELDVTMFVTSEVTKMSSMFRDCDNLKNIVLTNFDTSKVTNMSYMFSDSSSLIELNLSSFNTSLVQSMDNMFNGDTKLTNIIFGNNFNTQNVTTMASMFERCSSLTKLDLNFFNTSYVTTMESMFEDCRSLESLNISNFNTSRVTTMYYMFDGCSNLTKLDLTSFNTSRVSKFDSMFSYCTSLSTIYVTSNFVTSSSYYHMFYNSPNIVGGKGTKYNSNKVNNEYAHIDGGESNPGYFTEKNNGIVITLHPNGGNITQQIINVNSGSTIGDLPIPTRDGYSFDGWYTSLTDGIKVTSSYIPEGSMVLYAKYVAITSETCPNNEVIVNNDILCKRASKLHKEDCIQNQQDINSCKGDGYTTSITYGTCGTYSENTTLETGNAFTCDVNKDGKYDEEKERFYYVSDYYDLSTNTMNNDYATLIYYKNIDDGSPSLNGSAYDPVSATYADTLTKYRGPIQADSTLPYYSSWNNIRLLTNNRQILTKDNGTTVNSVSLPLYEYDNLTSRLLTYQELYSGCYDGTNELTETGSLSTKCKFLFEGTKYSSEEYPTEGIWLETAYDSTSYSAYTVSGKSRSVSSSKVNEATLYGVKPVIEVEKSRIAYNGYVIGLDATSGSISTSSIIVKPGEEIGELPIPTTPEGQGFVGWYTSFSGGTKVESDFVPTGSMTIYAQYDASAEYEVSFDSNGGSDVNSIRVQYNNEIGTLPTPTKEGYRLLGWYTDTDYTTQISSETKVTYTITFYARWEKVVSNNCPNNENIQTSSGTVCRRAKTLHQSICNNKITRGNCYNIGYHPEGSKETSTITYGSCGDSGYLAAGDAFDCDVNGDGVFDSENERFYYISDYYDTNTKKFDYSTAVLIYNNNYSNGVPNYTTTHNFQLRFDNYNETIDMLPSSASWSNVSLKNYNRQAVDSYGNKMTGDDGLSIIDYSGHSARLLTSQEYIKGCPTSSGGRKCEFLLDNSLYNYYENNMASGFWFETLTSSTAAESYIFSNTVGSLSRSDNDTVGVRPVIELDKKKMSYGAEYIDVSFDANNGTGTTATQNINKHEIFELNTSGFERDIHIFTGWNTEPDGTGTAFVDGQEIEGDTFDSNVTLYAQWLKEGWEFENESTWDNTQPLKNQKWKYFENNTQIIDSWIFTGRDNNHELVGNKDYYYIKDGYLYLGWLELDENIYFFSWFDSDNDGIVDGNMIKDTTINIDGVDYTFDSKGVCQNPPTRSALSSPNSIQSQQSDNSTPNEIQEQQPDSSTDTDSNNENENIINEDSEVGASIYSIIRRKNKHSYNSVYDKELIQLKKYFMGILY